MVKKTDKYDFNQELIEYYKTKVNQLEEARRFLRVYERNKRSGNYSISDRGKLESEEEFNEVMDDLLFFAYPKLKKSSNIELPQDLEDSIDDEVYTCKDLGNKEKKVLLYKVRDLFEALNITSLEREKWEAEGIGVVDKEADQK